MTSPTASTSSLSNCDTIDVGARLHVERAEVGELAGRDQHAARVHADVARQALERLGEREQLAHFLLVPLALGEQRLHLARLLAA